jgi:hypothetical protein
LRLLGEQTDGLLTAELDTSDDTASLAVSTDVKNKFISFLECYLMARTTALTSLLVYRYLLQNACAGFEFNIPVNNCYKIFTSDTHKSVIVLHYSSSNT